MPAPKRWRRTRSWNTTRTKHLPVGEQAWKRVSGRFPTAAPTTWLPAWTSRFRNGNATTARFVSLAEIIANQDLTEFFDAWRFDLALPDSRPVEAGAANCMAAMTWRRQNQRHYAGTEVC